MSVVIGTAGHIDHGKTTLLAALTGIDADRLPEERRRGMTIDVGYAHRVLPDGRTLDFVDVPGHDRLVGNMLVGAGEIDAALLVVAADDGPRAQTREHLALLHGLGIADGCVAITKADAAHPDRIAAVMTEVAALLAPTALAGAPLVAVSARTGAGMDALGDALAALADRVAARPATAGRMGGLRLAIDRVFAVRGRGTVVTGSLRGGTLGASATRTRSVPTTAGSVVHTAPRASRSAAGPATFSAVRPGAAAATAAPCTWTSRTRSGTSPGTTRRVAPAPSVPPRSEPVTTVPRPRTAKTRSIA
ncbi:MAG: GTP-binding protein, partial [Chloroflexota bacterium]